jgi:hypothetical protein
MLNYWEWLSFDNQITTSPLNFYSTHETHVFKQLWTELQRRTGGAWHNLVGTCTTPEHRFSGTWRAPESLGCSCVLRISPFEHFFQTVKQWSSEHPCFFGRSESFKEITTKVQGSTVLPVTKLSLFSLWSHCCPSDSEVLAFDGSGGTLHNTWVSNTVLPLGIRMGAPVMWKFQRAMAMALWRSHWKWPRNPHIFIIIHTYIYIYNKHCWYIYIYCTIKGDWWLSLLIIHHP